MTAPCGLLVCLFARLYMTSISEFALLPLESHRPRIKHAHNLGATKMQVSFFITWPCVVGTCRFLFVCVSEW